VACTSFNFLLHGVHDKKSRARTLTSFLGHTRCCGLMSEAFSVGYIVVIVIIVVLAVLTVVN
jgi:hypothetical protein